jgi:hypothetical protein
MDQQDKDGEITLEEKEFGKRLEAELHYGISPDVPTDQLEKIVSEVEQAIKLAKVLVLKRAQMSPQPVRRLTPDTRWGLATPKQKQPSRLKKLLARLGGYKGATNV